MSLALEPTGALSDGERESLSRLSPAPDEDEAGEPFRLRLEERTGPTPGGAEVEVVDEGERLRVRHRDFAAVLDPAAGSGRLGRDPGSAFALPLTLRVAMCSRLPLLGGVPLHAAAMARGGRAIVFYGPSGAGKSTLAALSRDAVLSDELVSVRPVRGAPAVFACRGTGVWGTLGARPVPPADDPVRALVLLDRGDAFHLDRLGPRPALRSLVGVTMVPAAPWLWRPAMAVLERLVSRVPVYRMRWSPEEPPFEALDEVLAD